ncbi:MAG: CsgG/HfaB family protein [Cellvibrionaceae bacterium]|nr:CsgG/HfaB family protein [Cellvibrionaceae bacterium]
MLKNRVIVSLLVTTCLYLLAFATPSSAAPKVGIVDFENRAAYRISWHLHIGKFAADMLTTELVKSTDFEVYERKQMKSVLKEQDFGQSGRFDPSTAAQIGRLIGLDYIITGAITEFGVSEAGGGGGGVHVSKRGYHANVDVRIVDVQSGRVVFADSGAGNKASANVRVFGFGGGEKRNQKSETAVMRLAMSDVAKKIKSAGLTKKMRRSTTSNPRRASPNAVLIAHVDGKSVTLSKGTKAGLKVGQTLTIQRPKGEIKDPASGRVIKVQYTPVGEVQIVSVEASYADGRLLSGKGIKIGDEVKTSP